MLSSPSQVARKTISLSLALLPPARYTYRMEIPERIVTQQELRRQNGERGTRKYIAYQGVVYDVSDCPRWRKELHERLHFPGHV